MNGKDLLIALNGIDPAYIAEAARPRRARPVRRTILIAAAAALAAILVGCGAAYVLNLRDLRMGQVTRTQYAPEGSGQPPETVEATVDIISAQGILGSPNFRATREWAAFREGYVLDPAEEFAVPEGYMAYSAYSQALVDKVDEICEKYDLEIMGPLARMQPDQFHVLEEALGIGLFREGIALGSGVGWFAQCGNFNIMVNFTLTDPAADCAQTIGATLHYSDKAYFDDLYFAVEDVQTVRQRHIPLDDGTSVLAVGEGDRVFLLYDRGDAFYSVLFDPFFLDTGEPLALTDGDLERIVSAIDFTIRPRQPDMDQVRAQGVQIQ